MSNIELIVWIFPILFMIHEFEEIIFMEWWINKNKNYLSQRFPKVAKKLLPHFNNITTSAFSLGVAEEFIIVITITIISYAIKWYDLWIGMFIAFIVHLAIHCVQAIILKKYIPSVVTSIVGLPICLYILNSIIGLFEMKNVVLFSLVASIVMVVNLLVIHRLMESFNRWLLKK